MSDSEVYLASPAVAAACAVTGKISAPDELGMYNESMKTGRPLMSESISQKLHDRRIHEGIGKVFKYGDNVDTDVIIPARYLNSSDPAELANALYGRY